jgi:TetR/AcrR family transcriptional repressor of mexJK operon
MENATDRRGPGRPKSSAKRDAILAAARDLFLEHGFSQTSMEMVASAAGVGKPTVYSHFGSKEELFSAIIALRRQMLMGKMTDLLTPTDDPRADLEQFAFRFLQLILGPGSPRWDRLVIAESGRHPQLAQKLFKAGPANVLSLIRSYLDAQHEAGRLHVPDTQLAAEQFMGLCFGVELVRTQMASLPRRSDKQRRKRANAATSVFLAAYGTSSTRSNQ